MVMTSDFYTTGIWRFRVRVPAGVLGNLFEQKYITDGMEGKLFTLFDISFSLLCAGTMPILVPPRKTPKRFAEQGWLRTNTGCIRDVYWNVPRTLLRNECYRSCYHLGNIWYSRSVRTSIARGFDSNRRGFEISTWVRSDYSVITFGACAASRRVGGRKVDSKYDQNKLRLELDPQTRTVFFLASPQRAVNLLWDQ
ncbi:hypothetical protein EI94DRAFT_1325845 [Lactarius quietus]|nr:hypothetical protein EI94DRAFT_1325845 [Lactarius quietus]